jgi:hypothetical protein
MHSSLLLSLLLRHCAHALTDAMLALGLLILAVRNGSGDGLAPDLRVSAAGAGDGHDHAPASDKGGGDQAYRGLGQGRSGQRGESGPIAGFRKEGPVTGRLVELHPGSLQMPNASLKLPLQQDVEVALPPVFCGHLL